MPIQLEIDRILTRLDGYRCRHCHQVGFEPHVIELPKSPKKVPLCKMPAPLPPGFPLLRQGGSEQPTT